MRTTYFIESRGQGSAKPLATLALDRRGEILLALNPPILRQLNERDAEDIAESVKREILKLARPAVRKASLPQAGK